jgi:hypothetical protein
MAALNRKERSYLFQRFASGLKYPYIFILLLVLFLVDLMTPDPILLVDEAILGLLAVLFGTWKDRRRGGEEPSEKNVTPPK